MENPAGGEGGRHKMKGINESRELLNLFDKEQRVEIEYPGFRKEVGPHAVRFVSETSESSFVLHSTLNESNADSVIRDQIDFFKHIHKPFEWKVFDHDTPVDLKERLSAHGFQADEVEAVMVLDLRKTPQDLIKPVLNSAQRISAREQLEDVITVEEQVWNDDFGWISDRLGNDLEVPDYLQVYVAYVDGNPACTGWIYFHPNSRFASLWGGSTVAGYRTRGLYTSVLAVRVQEALKRGYDYLFIDASPMSRPIVKKHGFRLLTNTTPYNWKPE